MNKPIAMSAVIVSLLVGASVAQAQLFQPDGATASSEFSSSYDVLQAIDGSGLPLNFTPNSVHATYAVGNHWTTVARDLHNDGNAWANFLFNTDRTIGTFHLWNHLSNGVAADPGYAVTLFDLRFFDAADTEIGSMIGLTAQPNVSIAQSYAFAPIDGVRRVQFTIRANNGSPNYTGVGEVAFESVPAPASAGLLAFAAMAAGRRRR